MNLSTRHSRKPFLSKISSYIEYSVSQLLLAIFVGINLFATNIYASETALDVGKLNSGSILLTPYISILEDPSHNLSITDIQKAEYSFQFKNTFSSSNTLNLGYSRSAYWLRFELTNSSEKSLERILEISYSRIAHIHFYQPLTNGIYNSILTGNAAPFSSRPHPNRFFVFPIAVPAHSVQIFFIRIESPTDLLIPAKLWDPHAYEIYGRNDYLTQAWYFGMASAMVLFNLLIFLTLWDLVYLLYISFVTSAAITLAAQNGLAKEFLWQNSMFWSEIDSMVGYCISLLTLLLFMRQMLNTWKIIPKIDLAIKTQIGLLLISPIGLITSFQTFIKPVILVCLITIIIVISTSALCSIKRQRSAYFFVVAFLMLCVGGIMMIMRSFGLIASNVISTNGLQFGSALEMLLLGLALADRFNNIRKEKEKAQKEALEAQNLLLENLKSQERLLKERVEERTIALSKSNSALVAANVELEEKRLQLEQLAVTDRLTGLYNRFMLDHVLETELYRSQYHSSQFALVLLDIDHFKLVNDNYGHPVGDQVLIEFARLLTNNVRHIDITGRWGGEEFLIICRNTEMVTARTLVETLRGRISQHTFPVIGSKTSSFGITEYKKGDSIMQMMSRVDKALYRAKRAGRNRIECEI